MPWQYNTFPKFVRIVHEVLTQPESIFRIMAGESVRPHIVLKVEPELSAHEFVDVLRRSGLSERRPVSNPAIIQGMLEHADLIVTARTTHGLLVGVARSISDFHYCTYLSDLAVDANFQRQGIGRQLIDYTHEQAGRNTALILLSAPAASTYYPHIGLSKHDSCWIIPRVD